MALVIKKRPTRSQLMAMLASPTAFVEALMAPDGEAIKLDPWQAHYLDSNDKKVTAILKSRRVGGSWAMTAKMFVRSQTRPRYNGTFISMNREEARGKIVFADELHDALPARWRFSKVARSKDEIVFADAKGRRSVLRSLAARAPRGRGGDVGISELPHCQNASSIYEGALHVTARDVDDRLTVESTPLGKGGIFHDLVTGKFPGVGRYEIPWWLSNALCSDIEEASEIAPALTTAERVERFGSDSLKAIYSAMAESAFRQESELAFIEMEDSALPYELLNSCAEPDFSVHEGTLRYKAIDRAPSANDLAWLNANRKGHYFAGFDPGRKKDPSAIVILDRTDGKYETRMVVAMADTPFSVQQEVIESFLRRGVSKLSIDATGLGIDIAEKLKRKWRSQIEGVNFTAQSKSRLVNGAYNLFVDKKIVIPAERVFMAELSSIQEKVSDSGALLYHAPRGKTGHADRAWALFLAIDAARAEPENFAAPQYESLTKRKQIDPRSK